MDLPTNQPIPFYVNAGRLWRSQQQRFSILWTPSMENPQPSLFLIGSIGNKYKVYLSLDYISCSCNDYFSCTSSTQKLCKHILLLLQIICPYGYFRNASIASTPNTHFFQTSSVQKWFLPPIDAILCMSITPHSKMWRLPLYSFW